MNFNARNVRKHFPFVYPLKNSLSKVESVVKTAEVKM